MPLAGELSGGDLKNGEWVVDCGLAIGAGAEHLGTCNRCPIAEVEASRDLLDRVFTEYQSIKRLKYRHDLTIPVELLIAIDDEVERLRLRDLERERALNELKSKRR